jgi:sugar phosphate isomerase/epimerase
MLKLAAFADEISPDIDEQIRVCLENGVKLIELRGVAGKNVLDFDDALCAQIKAKLTAGKMGIAAIGSPIGKVKITDAWEPHFERFKKAVKLAEFFDAPLIRIFSFYPAEDGGLVYSHRDEVMRRMKAMAAYVENRNVVLVHENEGHIYGEMGKECVDLLKTVNSPKLKNCFDFANYVVAGQNPMCCWGMLKPWLAHIHVKDALYEGGRITPAGEGDGSVARLLEDAWKSGYRGFLTLEPHLAHAGQFAGFSGPELFKVAVDALKKICKEKSIPLDLA